LYQKNWANLRKERRYTLAFGELPSKSRIIIRHSITISDEAKNMRINRSHFNNFANGKVAVTAPFAMKLEKVTGISTGFWINLQKTYDR
jgi:addiction module HigA family antidote